MPVDLHVPVMGSEAHLRAVDADRAVLDAAAAELRRLERLWSRFDPDSEISRLRRHSGSAVAVSPETAALIAAAVDAWVRTDGRFDPTVVGALEQCGYDRTFDEISPVPRCGAPAPSPGCRDIEVDLDAGTVFVPAGVGLDVGGIAKGVAADLAVELLLDAGARGACVNVGGDLRVAGEPGVPGGWVVAIEHPDPGEVARIAITAGGVATTSTRKRRWHDGVQERHHVIDPATGQPAAGGPAGVTVIAATAALAEVWSTALLLDGRAGHPLAPGVSAVVVVEDAQARWITAPDGTVAA